MTEQLNDEEGQSIVRVLLDPQAIVKPSYRPNELIFITLASGNSTSRGRFRLLAADEEPPGASGVPGDITFFLKTAVLRVPGVELSEGTGLSESIRLAPDLAAKVIQPLPPPAPALVLSKPGVYAGIIEFEAASLVVHMDPSGGATPGHCTPIRYPGHVPGVPGPEE